MRVPSWVYRARFIPARAGNTQSVFDHQPTPPVYPRSRGEHAREPVASEPASQRASEPVNGLSPLARGTQRELKRRRESSRFIPARAGNTKDVAVAIGQIAVYPRSRGEHQVCLSTRATHHGLSPLARGTRRMTTVYKRLKRFIPARAGNTPSSLREVSHGSVYPRSRGEHDEHHCPAQDRPGLSPLARGTPALDVSNGNGSRFIPARAGNTQLPRYRGFHEPVYPRSRGEHLHCRYRASPASGLSPLARGTPALCSATVLQLRFIPARAGNTPEPNPETGLYPVYPRSRGEHGRNYDKLTIWCGLSPLARGTLELMLPSTIRSPVYPRSRGEHHHGLHLAIDALGLSPLARGTLIARNYRTARYRFIPARAGNTLN